MQPLRPRVVPAAYHPLSLAGLPSTTRGLTGPAGMPPPFSFLWHADLFRDLRPALHLHLPTRLPYLPTPPYLQLTPTPWDGHSLGHNAGEDYTRSGLQQTLDKDNADDSEVLSRLREVETRAHGLLSPLSPGAGFLSPEVGVRSTEDSPAEESQLRELERFASNFKARRIKLGFTQTNVGKNNFLICLTLL